MKRKEVIPQNINIRNTGIVAGSASLCTHMRWILRSFSQAGRLGIGAQDVKYRIPKSELEDIERIHITVLGPFDTP